MYLPPNYECWNCPRKGNCDNLYCHVHEKVEQHRLQMEKDYERYERYNEEHHDEIDAMLKEWREETLIKTESDDKNK